MNQLYSVGESEAAHGTEKVTNQENRIHIPPVDFPSFTLDVNGHIRTGESAEADTW